MTFYRKKLRSLTVAGGALTLTVITGLTGLATVTGLAGAGTAWAAPQPAGAAYAWGANFDGQLGDGTTTERTAPVPVRLPAGAYTAVAAGEFHSLALTSGGAVYAWGANQYGQLGDGTTTQRTTPCPVGLPPATRVTAIAAGAYQSLALTSDGRVFAWGGNQYGELGDGTTTVRNVPVLVRLPAGTAVKAIAANGYHSMALTSDGRVFTWGRDNFGQLGDGAAKDRTIPVQVALPAGTSARAIAAGFWHSLALISDGRVLAWGNNVAGQLGDGGTANAARPVQVHLPAGSCVYSLGAGGVQSLATLCDGRLLAWGGNQYGQLGIGTESSGSPTPVMVDLPAGAHVVAAVGGDIYTLAVTCDGRVLGWGNNFQGQLGDGTTTSRTRPVRALLPAGTVAAAVSVGDGTSLAVANPAA